mmetsp:Transcript_35414/g.53255  ORF Transcript_35414/g.53255 Transcript_35414/m.53255 type:complete len:276 (-) Transcript_35414:195-1022(-)
MGTQVDSIGSVSQAELQADIIEVQQMLAKAERPNVKKELSRLLMVLLHGEGLQGDEAQAKTAKVAAKASIDPSSVAAADAPAAASPATAAAAAASSAKTAVAATGPWTEITTFALDTGGFSGATVEVDIRLKGVEALPAANVTCDFTESSLDLKVVGLDGKNLRFFKTNLEKDIIPAESAFRVKKNHVILMLKKAKGQYGYDNWTDLCAKGRRQTSAAAKSAEAADPSSSIVSMMKELYDSGDDQTKQMIGEAMFKAQRGEKYTDQDNLKMPSLG